MATKIATKVVNVGAESVTFQFADGSKVEGSLQKLSPTIITHLALHGLAQKLGDSYSGAEGITDAKEKFHAVLDMLLAGDWNAGRSATGGIWVDALALAAKVDREKALEKWNGLSENVQKLLKGDAKIKAAKAAIELRRAQEKAASAGAGGEFDLDDL